MLGAIRHSEGARGLLAALALLILGIQLIAPSGFMPMRTATGVVVTMCTGQGAVNVVVQRDDAGDRHMPEDQDRAMNQHCLFSGAAAQPLLPPLSLAEINLPVWQLAFGPIAFAVRTGWIARLAAPPPPSSGPPATF